MDTGAFDYDLPEQAIAQSAIEPRDTARLLVTSTLEDRTFVDLPVLLDRGDLLVVNRTRVRAARLFGTKPATGGAVEVLLTRRVDPDRWEALVRPSRRVRPGTEFEFGPMRGVVLAGPERGIVTMALSAGSDDVEDLLPSHGTVPLPPYFHGEMIDPERYQTIFAKTIGSAAAPTAALHFTRRVVDALAARGVDIAEVDLEVGLDTFRPMAEGPLDDHEIHREHFRVPAATAVAIESTRRRGGRVVAVGTTVVRTLETMAVEGGLVEAGEGESELFIRPGYRLRVVDAVVTNFHAPRTTLVVLVATLLGPRWREVYAHALESGYRFLSFGDAMLIDRPENGR